MRTLPFEYAVRNLGRNPARLLLTVGGSALVVLLVLTATGFVNGMQAAFVTSGREANVILMGSGSEESIERSEVPMRTSGIVAASLSGLVKRAGVDAVSPEAHVAIPVKGIGGEGAMSVIRGIEPAAFLVHDEVRVIAGRPPRAGASELLAGALIARSMGFDPPAEAIGTVLEIDEEPYEIVGVHEAAGGVAEGELWTSLTDLMATSQRDTVSCVVVAMDDAEFSDLEAFAASRLDLELIAMPETDYYAKLSAFFRPIGLMVLVTAALIAIGAVLGGLNTTYAAFASRVREIGTLQTLGYSRRAIALSLVQESVLAASIGTLIACGLGTWLLDKVVVQFSMGAFGLRMDAVVMAWGLGTGLLLGAIGAILPAWRCLRLPIAESLKAGE
ncbi:MAG: ABC transporter permease [Phycisphaerales bacterium]|nr:ABC transporter permease [Phycisphaerales bacterium]